VSPAAARFVWLSTDKSVAEGIPSTLAAPEVVVAVAAYWAIAIYFETTTRLWVSICVASLLLLRCEQSVALGAWWVDLMMRVRNVLSTASDYPAPARIRLVRPWVVLWRSHANSNITVKVHSQG